MALNFSKEEMEQLKKESEEIDSIFNKYKDEGISIEEARDIVEGNISLEEVLKTKNKEELLFQNISAYVDYIKQTDNKEDGEKFAIELKRCIDEFISISNNLEYYTLVWNRIVEMKVSNMLKYKKLKLSLIKFKEKQESLVLKESKEEVINDLKLANYDYIPVRYEGAFGVQKYKTYIKNNKDFMIYCHSIAKKLKPFAKEEAIENIIYMLYEINDYSCRFTRLIPYFKEFYELKYKEDEVIDIILKSYQKYKELMSFKDFKIVNTKYVLSNDFFLYKRILKVTILFNNDLNVEVIYNEKPNVLVEYDDSLYKVAFDFFERQRQSDSFTNELIIKVDEYLKDNQLNN